MTRRDWWIGIAVVVVAILVHALIPRYEWRDWRGAPLVRVDRWTGTAVMGAYRGPDRNWVGLLTQPAAPPPVATTRSPATTIVPSKSPPQDPESVLKSLGAVKIPAPKASKTETVSVDDIVSVEPPAPPTRDIVSESDRFKSIAKEFGGVEVPGPPGSTPPATPTHLDESARLAGNLARLIVFLIVFRSLYRRWRSGPLLELPIQLPGKSAWIVGVEVLANLYVVGLGMAALMLSASGMLSGAWAGGLLVMAVPPLIYQWRQRYKSRTREATSARLQ